MITSPEVRIIFLAAGTCQFIRVKGACPQIVIELSGVLVREKLITYRHPYPRDRLSPNHRLQLRYTSLQSSEVCATVIPETIAFFEAAGGVLVNINT